MKPDEYLGNRSLRAEGHVFIRAHPRNPWSILLHAGFTTDYTDYTDYTDGLKVVPRRFFSISRFMGRSCHGLGEQLSFCQHQIRQAKERVELRVIEKRSTGRASVL
jgi:hypothetical protein